MTFSFGRLVSALLVLLFAVDVCMRFLPADYYAFRAWEAMTLYHGRPGIFAPSRTYFNSHASGDLAHIGNYPDLRQFRPERFTTDGCGNRNRPDIFDGRPADIMLLGSSFTAGSGVDDYYTLSAQLERLGGLKAYNAGGADVDQSGWIRVLAKKLMMNQAGQGTVVLEYLERFSVSQTAVPDAYDWLSEADTLCKPGSLWRTRGGWMTMLTNLATVSPLEIYSRNLLQMLQNDVVLPNPYKEAVVRETLSDGTPILFYPGEVASAYAARDAEGPIQYWKQLSDELAKADLKLVLLLVPNKYTIYYPMLRAPARGQPQGSRYLNSLEGRLRLEGIPVINLTDEYMRAAVNEFRQGRYIYWLDDTHWNAEGIRIAASAIARNR
jgi:SGNH hydrolase-like domain, acetyltransferase AlgX